ncbi:MAG: monovalent cation/H(+) antiporter subunit G [Cellulomonadaceae bacterium]
MIWDIFFDHLSGVFLVLGAFLSFVAGVGVVRFPDLLARMHAATKPQVLGLILVLLGLELRLRSGPVLFIALLVALFQMLTSPIAAHMVGRAGYRTGKVREDLLAFDDLSDDIDAATAAAERDGVTTQTAELVAEGVAAPEDSTPGRDETSGRADDGGQES